MIDIDFFKKINDKFGHIEGDDVLVEFSETLLASRESDLISRFGGEEFAIASVNTTKEGVLKKQRTYVQPLMISLGQMIKSPQFLV